MNDKCPCANKFYIIENSSNLKGPTGPTGPAPTLTIGTVTTGAPGTNASVTITPTAG